MHEHGDSLRLPRGEHYGLNMTVLANQQSTFPSSGRCMGSPWTLVYVAQYRKGSFPNGCETIFPASRYPRFCSRSRLTRILRIFAIDKK